MMDFSNYNIGLGITGSFCTFAKARKEIQRLCDMGANPDVEVDDMVRFAQMGAAYARVVLGIEHPRVGLLAKKNSYPRELSGGQKQRVAIVRALCMHPEILLFDEVTAALDPEMVREVLDVMLDLAKQGKTMIIVTHEMQFARAIANRVIFLDGGKIVEEAAPAEFFERPKTERAQRFLRTFTFDAVK